MIQVSMHLYFIADYVIWSLIFNHTVKKQIIYFSKNISSKYYFIKLESFPQNHNHINPYIPNAIKHFLGIQNARYTYINKFVFEVKGFVWFP